MDYPRYEQYEQGKRSSSIYYGYPPEEEYAEDEECSSANYGSDFSANTNPQTPVSSPPPREPWGYRQSGEYDYATEPSNEVYRQSNHAVNGEKWYQQDRYMNVLSSPETSQHNYYQQDTRYNGLQHPRRELIKQGRDYFISGNIFLTLRHKNAGKQGVRNSGTSDLSYDGSDNRVYSSWRLMIVIGPYSKRSSACVSIHTYHRQGSAKRDLDPASHAILYDENRGPHTTTPEDQELQQQNVLAVTVELPGEVLEPISYANFEKVNTIEHDTEICHVGRIANVSTRTFHSYVREILDALHQAK